MPSEKERLRQIFKRMNEIMNLSDEDCERIENEFKDSEEKSNRTVADA